MYSCAYWGPEEGGVDGDLIRGSTPGDLEAAQRRKIHRVLTKARVRPGHRILEFGSGWGGLAIEVRNPHFCYRSALILSSQAARSFGCEVDSLTLSVEQKQLAEERIKAAGLEDRIRIHLMDYRDIPSHFAHAFDAFISIEMLEHVGSQVSGISCVPFFCIVNGPSSQHYPHYFKLVDFALKPQNATIVVSSSTFPESRYTGYQ